MCSVPHGIIFELERKETNCLCALEFAPDNIEPVAYYSESKANLVNCQTSSYRYAQCLHVSDFMFTAIQIISIFIATNYYIVSSGLLTPHTFYYYLYRFLSSEPMQSMNTIFCSAYNNMVLVLFDDLYSIFLYGFHENSEHNTQHSIVWSFCFFRTERNTLYSRLILSQS